ncbi:hypothetical protein GCM10023322_77540 [Rugosimonospora acidiphila]|uniref:Pectate lyase superfamily protein domain-containing protein n=1 Tax=Rugosimonospora acidiphila TaxID=556531 RepID=A0ABP9SSY6_9ACTN
MANSSRRDMLRSALTVGGLTVAATALVPPDGAAAATTTGLDWVDVTSHGADPTGAADSTQAINAALAATPVGGVCYLPAGTYRTSKPLVVPPAVTLLGSHGTHLDITTCAIRPSSNFTGLALPATTVAGAAYPAATVSAVIVMLDQVAGGYSGPSQEQRIANVSVDCSDLPAGSGIDGITAVGYVHGVCLDNVAVNKAPAHGFTATGRDGGNPYSWRLTRVAVNAAGTYGFNVANLTDSTFIDCEAIGTGGSGWYIAGDSNSHFTNCRAEWAGLHGFEVHSSGQSSYTFTACSTDRNSHNGMYIADSGGVGPILLTGCMFNRDGRNGGAGGGGFAGLAVSGSTSPIVVNGCVTAVHADDGGTGVESPQYGISVKSASYVAVDGGFYWGVSAGWFDGGGNITLRRGPNIAEATGPQTAPKLNLRNSWGTDNGSGLAIALNGADQTGLTLSNVDSNINQPLLLMTAGASAADALIKGRVAGDTSSRVVFSAAGSLSLGPGNATTDATWGRLAKAQIGSADSDIVAGLAGKGLRVKEGTNAKMGTLTLNGTTAVTVATTAVTASSRIFLTVQTPGGTPAGVAYVSARTAGKSFSVKGAANDKSVVAWLIIEPA